MGGRQSHVRTQRHRARRHSALCLAGRPWYLVRWDAPGGRFPAKKAVRVAELGGIIARLDDEMVMAAVSGDRCAVETFDEDVPKLDTAIGIASPEIRQEFNENSGEAHPDLLAIERRAGARCRRGPRGSPCPARDPGMEISDGRSRVDKVHCHAGFGKRVMITRRGIRLHPPPHERVFRAISYRV